MPRRYEPLPANEYRHRELRGRPKGWTVKIVAMAKAPLTEIAVDLGYRPSTLYLALRNLL